jgi:hypothetical protein
MFSWYIVVEVYVWPGSALRRLTFRPAVSIVWLVEEEIGACKQTLWELFLEHSYCINREVLVYLYMSASSA